MLARVISFQVPPERLEEIENSYRSTLLPFLEAHRGFSGVFLPRHEDTSQTLELTPWEDEAAKLESERTGGLLEWKTNALEAITGEATTIEDYELRLMA